MPIHRLDGAWGEPIRDLRHWSTDIVYVPDSWASEVPDTFALLPRKWSDQYFSMDILMQKNIFCLGGGNFDPSTLQASYLLNRLHFTLPQVVEAQAADCNLLHPEGEPWNKDPKTGIQWAEAGLSEQILKRKLKSIGVAFDQHNLAYRSFFTVTVRPKTLADMCIYLHNQHMIGWARPKQYCQISVFVGCLVMLHDLKKLHRSSYGKCKLEGNMYTGESCLMSPKATKFNFMPFRIRQGTDNCMTGGEMDGFDGGWKDGPLSISPCISHQNLGHSVVAVFTNEQMFHIYPHVKTAQPLRVASTNINPTIHCLTVGVQLSLYFSKCKEPYLPTQLFHVVITRKKRTMYAQFEWNDLERQHNATFCVTNSENPNNHAVLEPCNVKSGGSQREYEDSILSSGGLHKNFGHSSIFILERVNSTSNIWKPSSLMEN